MKYILFFTLFAHTLLSQAQVTIRDTTISWRHHDFILDKNNSMMAHTTQDDEISQVIFDGKVIENELIRLVMIPEYGGRVISFVYKPTGHEYLYQSECGSPYGIGDGNFYYDWLMVYGGIFPTFTEPEHGKSWFLPWKYTLVESTDEKVQVSMQMQDTIDFAGAPGQFNNGATGITCRVDVIVYKGRSSWDFDVTLTNNSANTKNYEYWTCTTLTPGSEIGNTGSPLTSKIIAPVTKYEAAWSPGGWIGNYGSLRDFSKIDELSEWSNMGIAYAQELTGNYWGVINPENGEGIMRISDNQETPGLKLWTWGKSNVDNDLYDFSNGGADNYIELWAGTSEKFFSDAQLSANETKSWRETYTATTGLSEIKGINAACAVNYQWNPETQQLEYEFNGFQLEQEVTLQFKIEEYPMMSVNLDYNELGQSGSLAIPEEIFTDGEYDLTVLVKSKEENVLLEFEGKIEIDINEPLNTQSFENAVFAHSSNAYSISIDRKLPNGDVQIMDIQGKMWHQLKHTQNSPTQFHVPKAGIYIVTYTSNQRSESVKVIVQ